MALFRRISNLFRRNRLDSDIDAELQAHIDLRIDDNIANGMSLEEARRDALLRFGNRTSTRERVAASDTTLRLESLARDISPAACLLFSFTRPRRAIHSFSLEPSSP